MLLLGTPLPLGLLALQSSTLVSFLLVLSAQPSPGQGEIMQVLGRELSFRTCLLRGFQRSRVCGQSKAPRGEAKPELGAEQGNQGVQGPQGFLVAAARAASNLLQEILIHGE